MTTSAAAWARFVVGLTLAAKLVFIALLFPGNPNTVLSPDSGTYLRPARALLEKSSFSPSPTVAPVPEVVRTPGYPILIAAISAVFGERTWLLGAVSALFAAGTSLLLFHLTSRLFGETAGLTTIVLYSIEPSTFHYTTMVLSEAPFVFFLILAFTLWIDGPGAGSWRSNRLLTIGTCLAVATLIRPILYYALAPAAFFAIFCARRAGESLRRSATVGFALFLPVLVLVGGWRARNFAATGDSSFSHVQSGNLRFFRAGTILAMKDGLTLPAEREKLGWKEFVFRFGYAESEREAFGDARYADLFPETSRLPLVELSRRWRKEAWLVIAMNPTLAILVHLKGLFLLFTTPAPIVWGYQLGAFRPAPDLIEAFLSSYVRDTLTILAARHGVMFVLVVLSLVPLAVLYAGATRGLRRLGDGWKATPQLALLGFLLYYVAVMAAPESLDDRFRVPLVPILCVFAGAGLTSRSAKEAQRKIPISM